MHFWKQRELLKNDFFSIYDCVGVCNIHDSSFFFAFQLVSNCNLSKKLFDIFALPFPKKILKCIHWDFFCVCIKGVEFLLPLFFSRKKCLTVKMKPKYLHLSCSVAFLTWRAPLTPKTFDGFSFFLTAFRVNWANMQNNKSCTFQQSITQIKSSRP